MEAIQLNSRGEYSLMPLHAQNVLSSFESMRLAGCMTDVTIQVEHKMFKVHSVLMSASCAYFEKWFCHEQVKDLIIRDVTPMAVQKIISFFYTGKVHVCEDFVGDLLNAAAIMDLQCIIFMCHSFLKKNLNEYNLVSTLRLAEKYGFVDLIHDCRTLLVNNFSDFVQTTGYANLTLSDIRNFIIKSQCTMSNEVKFLAVMRWATSQKTQDATEDISIITLLSLIPISSLNATLISKYLSDSLRKKYPLCASYLEGIIDMLIYNPLVMLDKKFCQENAIYVVGGCVDNNESFIVFNVHTGQFAKLADMRTPHLFSGCAIIKGKLYVVGGVDSKSVEVYDCIDNSWQPLRCMPFEMDGASVTVLKGSIYTCGGFCRKQTSRSPLCNVNSTAMESVFKYDLTTDKWSFAAPLLEPRAYACALSVNGFLYIFGGKINNGLKTLSSCEKYNPYTNCWEEIASLPEPRCLAAAVAFGKDIFIFGGSDGSRVQSTVFKYDTHYGKWTRCKKMPYAARSLSATVVKKYIYITGGHDGLKSSVNVARFNPVCSEWQTSHNIPSGRFGHTILPVVHL